MKQYLDLMTRILEEGEMQDNRTGIPAITISGAHLRYDLQKGFPAITTRKLAFKTFMGELCGFLRGADSAATFRELGCKIWDQNANENEQWLANPWRLGSDSLGRIYGVQWRRWNAYKRVPEGSKTLLDSLVGQGYVQIARTDDCDIILHKQIDQVAECLKLIQNNPTNRRILFHAWNPAELDEMALPPCHLLYEFTVNVAKKELSLTMFQRSCDVPLGLVGNLATSAAMLHLFARMTGLTPKWLNWMGADVHIYQNQLDMVHEQLRRQPFDAPNLILSERVPPMVDIGFLDNVHPSDFMLEGYEHHPPLTAPMAV